MAIVDKTVIADTGGTVADVTAANALKTDSSHVTQPVSAASLPLPSGAATAAKQDTAQTTLDSIDTALGGTLTVDGSGVTQPVSDGGGSLTVDNGGTFAVQATLDAETTKVIGTVNVAASQTIAVTQATAANLKSEVSNAGTFPVQATLGAETTKVIGTVNVAAAQTIATTNAGTFVVQENGAALTALQLIDDVVYTDDTSTHTSATSKGVGIMAVATPTDTSVNANDFGHVGMTTDRKMHVAVMDALPAGTAAIGKLAANAGVTIGAVEIASAQNVGITPNTSGGLTTYHLVSAGSTNATVVKASAGQLFGWYIYNSNAAARKVTFHNASSTPTAGASVFFSLMIPATSGANVFSDIGIPFSTGISITTVTGLADNDSAAVAANDLIINLFYK